MKKVCCLVISCCLFLGLSPIKVQAKVDEGTVDLYETFSNKADKMKNEVGSRIYKWSMHLPDDAIVYKSDRVNFFNMNTESYKSRVEMEVSKNKDDLSLEEVFYKFQNKAGREEFWGFGEKEFVMDFATDSRGQRYIRIVKGSKDYDYFMVDAAAEEFREYTENRIYVANNYIYNLTISMNGEFYKQHNEMFDKLASSFKLYFDTNNPYIKELSDSVSTTREFKNTTYGWKITLNPYWKVEGTPNSRIQKFSQVYSDEELNNIQKNKKLAKDEFRVPEGIKVSLISSAQSGETPSKWAEKEVETLKNNYHSSVYEIIKNEPKYQNGINVHNLVVRYKTVTKDPYVVSNTYIIENGYKYLLTSVMKEEQYKDESKRKVFDSMINSFSTDSKYFSKYLGRITPSESLLNLESSKDLKMKKYNFETKINKGWNIGDNMYDLGNEFNNFDERPMFNNFESNISNSEEIFAFNPISNIRVSMNAGLDTNETKEAVSLRVERYLKDDEVRMGLAKVTIKSSNIDGADIYHIEKEYDLNAINKFVNEDETKKYDLRNLNNEYEYMVKKGKDIYVQNISVPVANATEKNKNKISEIWSNTIISKVNYSKENITWSDHKLEEFDKEKQNFKK